MHVVEERELRRLVPMRDAIVAVRDAFVAYAEGSFAQIPRIAAPSRTLFAMMAERTGLRGTRLGQSVKLVSYREENPTEARPMVQGVVVWFDGDTGEARFCIDGAGVTALRTGAASGVATDLFARPDARALAVIGTGAIAPDQIRAVCEVRPIRTVAIAGRDAAKARALAARMQPEFPNVAMTGYASAREAVAGADIICTATTSRTPLFFLGDVSLGVHVNAVGSFSPDMCEFGVDVVAAAARVCVDDLSAISDAGELATAIAAKQLQTDFVSLIGDTLREGSVGAKGGITIFKSIGIAAQDWAIANAVASGGIPVG